MFFVPHDAGLSVCCAGAWVSAMTFPTDSFQNLSWNSAAVSLCPHRSWTLTAAGCPELGQRAWISSSLWRHPNPSWLTHTPHCGFFICLLRLHPCPALTRGFGMQNVTNLSTKHPCEGGNNCCPNYSVRIKENSMKKRLRDLHRIIRSTDHNTAMTAGVPWDNLAFSLLEN